MLKKLESQKVIAKWDSFTNKQILCLLRVKYIITGNLVVYIMALNT